MRKEQLKVRQQELMLLRKNGYSLQAIGDIYHISRQRVYQIINTDYNKPPKRNKYEGISDEETDMPLSDRYPQLRRLRGRGYGRELVRIRDNQICQQCGKIWKGGENRFDVHHEDFDKEKTQKYDPRKEFYNLVTLCHYCHMQIHKQNRAKKKLSTF